MMNIAQAARLDNIESGWCEKRRKMSESERERDQERD